MHSTEWRKLWRRVFLILMGLIFVPVCVRSQMMMMGSHMDVASMQSHQALMSWTGGADLEARPSEPKPPFDNNLRLLGAAWYGQLCTPCHGSSGDGNGPRANRLSPRPRDFTKGVYEFRSTPSGYLPTDEEFGGSSLTAFMDLRWFRGSRSQRTIVGRWWPTSKVFRRVFRMRLERPPSPSPRRPLRPPT
jgi:hypothetical protein